MTTPTMTGFGPSSESRYDPYMVPPDVEVAIKHGKANRVYSFRSKDRDNDGCQEICTCCGHPIEGDLIPLGAGLRELYQLGAGYALYFQFIKYCIGILVILMLVTGIFNIVSNVVAGDCSADTQDSDAYCVKGYILSFAIPNKREQDDFLWAQVALNFAGVILLIFFFQFVRYKFRKTSLEANDSTIGPSDYTVCVTGLPSDATEIELKQWMESINPEFKALRVVRPLHFGAFHDENVALRKKLTKLENELAALKAQNKEQSKQQVLVEKIRPLKERHTEIEKKMQENDFPLCSVVYITFEWSHFVSRLLTPSYLDIVLAYFLPGTESVKTLYKGGMVEIRRAPEPNDIIWQNMEKGRNRTFKVLMLNSISLMLSILCLGLLILTKWGQIKAKEELGTDSIIVQVLSFASSIVILVSNKMLNKAVEYITQLEKHHSYPLWLRAITQKLILNKFITTTLSALFAELILSDVKESQNRLQAINFYGKGGLLETIYWVFITNAVVEPALTVFDPSYMFTVFKRWRFLRNPYKSKMTQRSAHELFEGPNIQMSLTSKYASITNVLFLTAFYAPAMPFAMIYTAIGLFLFFWADKYVLLRRNARPFMLDNTLTQEIIEILEWCPLLFSIGNVVYVYTLKGLDLENAFPSGTMPLVWLTFAISLIHIFLPMEKINEKLCPIADQVTEMMNFQEAKGRFFMTDYDIENPSTRRQAMEKLLKERANAYKDLESEKVKETPVNTQPDQEAGLPQAASSEA